MQLRVQYHVWFHHVYIPGMVCIQAIHAILAAQCMALHLQCTEFQSNLLQCHCASVGLMFPSPSLCLGARQRNVLQVFAGKHFNVKFLGFIGLCIEIVIMQYTRARITSLSLDRQWKVLCVMCTLNRPRHPPRNILGSQVPRASLKW